MRIDELREQLEEDLRGDCSCDYITKEDMIKYLEDFDIWAKNALNGEKYYYNDNEYTMNMTEEEVCEYILEEAEKYSSGKMMREDSEVEIDAIYDDKTEEGLITLCDYSEKRGSAEFIRVLARSTDITEEEFDDICKKLKCAYVKDACFREEKEMG